MKVKMDHWAYIDIVLITLKIRRIVNSYTIFIIKTPLSLFTVHLPTIMFVCFVIMFYLSFLPGNGRYNNLYTLLENRVLKLSFELKALQMTFSKSRISHQRYSVKKGNTSTRVSFLIKLQTLGLRPATLLKKRLWHKCFPVNFAKFLRTPFFTEHLLVTASESLLHFSSGNKNTDEISLLLVTNFNYLEGSVHLFHLLLCPKI